MSRLTVKLLIAAVLVIAFGIAEYLHFRKRRKTRREAGALGSEEYLKYLKTEYQELKFRYKTSSNSREQDRLLREMEEVENKIIQIENELEEKLIQHH